MDARVLNSRAAADRGMNDAGYTGAKALAAELAPDNIEPKRSLAIWPFSEILSPENLAGAVRDGANWRKPCRKEA